MIFTAESYFASREFGLIKLWETDGSGNKLSVGDDEENQL